jgi:hypothetical protein
VNLLWGFVNFIIGLILLNYRPPQDLLAWALMGLGALLLGLALASHFGKVQAGK